MNARKIAKAFTLFSFTIFSSQILAAGLSETLNNQPTERKVPLSSSHQTIKKDYTQLINSSTISFKIPISVDNSFVVPFYVTFPPIGSDEYIEISNGGQSILKLRPQGNLKINTISSRFKAIDYSLVLSIYKNDGTLIAQNTSPKFSIKDGGPLATGMVNDDGTPFEYRERLKPGIYKSLMRYPNSRSRFISQYSFETDQGSVAIEGSYLLSTNPYIEFQGNFSTAKFTSMVPSN